MEDRKSRDVYLNQL